jgi:hypothetical protein
MSSPSMSKNKICLQSAFTLVSWSVYSLALKMEVTYPSGTSVDFQRSTWRYIPKNRTLKINAVSCRILKYVHWYMLKKYSDYYRYLLRKCGEIFGTWTITFKSLTIGNVKFV